MLNVPTFSQNDPQWKNFKLGNGTGTIGNYGCLLTSFTSLLKFYKNADWINPDRVNQLMKSYNGYAGATKNLWSWKVAEQFVVKYALNSSSSFNDRDVKNWINNGVPVIVKVDGKPIGGDEHYVLAIGDKKIIDPWDGKIKPFSTYTPLGYHVYTNIKEEVITKPVEKVMDTEKQDFLKKFNASNLNEVSGWIIGDRKKIEDLEKKLKDLKNDLEESQKQLEFCIIDKKSLENKPKTVKKELIDQPKPVDIVSSSINNGLLTKIIKFLESLRK